MSPGNRRRVIEDIWRDFRGTVDQVIEDINDKNRGTRGHISRPIPDTKASSVLWTKGDVSKRLNCVTLISSCNDNRFEYTVDNYISLNIYYIIISYINAHDTYIYDQCGYFMFVVH